MKYKTTETLNIVNILYDVLTSFKVLMMHEYKLVLETLNEIIKIFVLILNCVCFNTIQFYRQS